MKTNNGTVYVCRAGHVDTVPSMGMYLCCQVPVALEGKWAGRGSHPCGEAIITAADPDGSLEAAFRIGGPPAALAMIKERAARGERIREGAHVASGRETARR